MDIRRVTPSEYHRHVTTVFQGFSKYNSTVRENVGLGYVPSLQSPAAIERAMRLGGSDTFVGSLPNGVKTKLDGSGFEFMPYSPSSGHGMSSRLQHGLSGGEVSKVSPHGCGCAPDLTCPSSVAENSRFPCLYARGAARGRPVAV